MYVRNCHSTQDKQTHNDIMKNLKGQKQQKKWSMSKNIKQTFLDIAYIIAKYMWW